MYTLQENIMRYIDAGYPIIYIHSFEETKVDRIIKTVVGGRKVFEWDLTNELRNFRTKEHLLENKNINEVINFLVDTDDLDRKILVCKDMHYFLDDANVIAGLKNIAEKINEGLDSAIIIVSPILVIPKEIKQYVTVLEMDYIDSAEIKVIIQDFIKEYNLKPVDEILLDEMSIAFKGLSEFEVKNILALAYAENGELTRNDLSLIFEQKQQMIKKSGILEMIPLKESMNDIGGLDNLKRWLQRKSKVFKNINKAREFGVDIPKGVLIAGMPGCGKSLNAKAAANLFQVPLIRMDMGRLMGKYVGESEANMRRAIALAEAISPCVLWIDELEKAFAGIGVVGGAAEVTTRLFGNFLTWMQEKKSSAFVVATANDIMGLPPEILRKGRFDEIFYVGLPNDIERRKIFEIHIKKRRPMDWDKINLNDIVAQTKGYSGADIEGVVKESVENVFADERKELTNQDILSSIKNTHSLSELMKDSLDKMSKIYEERKFKNASEG